MKIGIIREGKVPPDQRVPLTPEQCAEVLVRFPYIELAVQPSDVRRITDAEYTEAGVQLQEDLSDCDVLFGVKEVPVDQLIPEKTYFFFSHTYKLQPYNAKLLRACIDKKVRLIDYELLKRPGGQRIIGFGRYAGIVGHTMRSAPMAPTMARMTCHAPSNARTARRWRATSPRSSWPRPPRLP